MRMPLRRCLASLSGLLASVFAIGGVLAGPIDPAAYPGMIRVACVGASITAGHGTTPGMGYSDQLQRLLGNHWKISNFGVSGTTMMRLTQHPYWAEKACQAAHDLQPDVVIILLGTNDTRPSVWAHHQAYLPDCEAFIESFKDLARHPRVFICRLPPIIPPGNFGLSPANLQEELPLIDQAGKEEKIDVVDVYSALLGNPALFPDHIHPDDAGAAIIARTVAEALTGRKN
jgi:acyl-CoA thioesterase-1